MPADRSPATAPQPFDLASVQGLSLEEVGQRLAEDGPNELPSTKPRTVPAIAL